MAGRRRHDGGVHVLLVEDDPGIATSSRDGLAAAGFTVDHVANGAAALTRSAQGGIDVIVLDLGLPDMDGRELCKGHRPEVVLLDLGPSAPLELTAPRPQLDSQERMCRWIPSATG